VLLPVFHHALMLPPRQVFGTSTEFSDAPTVSDIYNMRRILSARMNAIHDQTERLGANMERMERVSRERMERMEQVRLGWLYS
jgi:N6-adenosine-specific RNA methylase IME4